MNLYYMYMHLLMQLDGMKEKYMWAVITIILLQTILFIDSYNTISSADSILPKYYVDDDFILFYGDILVGRSTFTHLLKKYEEINKNSIISLVEVKDPEKYGIVNLENNKAKTIIEKPTDAKWGNLANAGIYILKPSIFSYIKETKKSKRGEYEITDSLQLFIDKGNDLFGFKIDTWWLDVGRPWDLLDANLEIVDFLSFLLD